MVTPQLLMSAMTVFKCSAIEAQFWLDSPAEHHMIFSSGEVYVSPLNN